jgi:hypothetical protein
VTQTGMNVNACKSCGSERFAVKDGRGQCFNPQCGLRQVDLGKDPAAAVFEEIYRRTHRELVARKAAPKGLEGLYAVSMVGVVPRQLNTAALWKPHVSKAKKQVEAHARGRQQGRPTREDSLALVAARERLRRLTDLAKQSEIAFKSATGAFVWFWTDDEHRIVRLTVKPKSDDERIVGSGGLFNHGLFAVVPEAQSTSALRHKLIVVQRPEDALAVQSAAIGGALGESLPPERAYVWCGAIGDANGAPTVRALARMPLLFMPDSPLGIDLTTAVLQRVNLDVVYAPGTNGVAEWLRSAASPWDALTEAAKRPQLLTRPFVNVRSEIDAVREMEGPVKKFHVERWSSEAIVRDLSERGRLYFDGQMAYVFLHDTHEVIPVDPDNTSWRHLAKAYGVMPKDAFAKALAVDVILAAGAEGTRANVYPFVHYDAGRNAVYLFDLEKSVYRIRANKIEIVPNGTDEKLFVGNPKWERFELDLEAVPADLPDVTERLLGAIDFTSTHLTAQETRHLFRVQLLGMFFPELFPTRPLLAMIGPKGSGKTSSLELLGTLLAGSQFKVAELTEDPRDFDASLTSDYLVVADNADRPIKWLPDKLAVVATGGTIKRREYYTTNKEVEFPIKAWLAITSRTPHFRREDVADRLLPFQIRRFKAYTALHHLKSQLLKDRNRLLTSLVRDVQKALRALGQKRNTPIKTSFRMADYAEFAIKVSSALGFHGNVEDVLNRLQREQIAFVTRHEPLFEWIDRWLVQQGNAGREISTGDLFGELQRLYPDPQVPQFVPWKTPQEFGRVLEEYASTLEALYGMTERAGRGNTKLVRLYAPRVEEDGSAVAEAA